MSNEVIVAILSFLGMSVGTFGGIVASSKLTNHRLAELEKKVDKHNNVIERMYVAEGNIRTLETKIDNIQHSLCDLK